MCLNQFQMIFYVLFLLFPPLVKSIYPISRVKLFCVLKTNSNVHLKHVTYLLAHFINNFYEIFQILFDFKKSM